MKRLHIWVGLFNLTILFVFAITGISATLPRVARPAPDVRFVPYETPAALTDKQVADDVWKALALPLVAPIPEYAVHRNDDSVLALRFFGPNGGYAVTVLEAEKQLRVEHAESPLPEFLDAMHATTGGRSGDLRVRLWAWYVNLSIFSLAFMSLSGVWLWLVSRPRLWWARLSLVIGSGLFAILWFVTR